MTTTDDCDPNPVVQQVYDELGELLAEGDDTFIDQGPPLVQEAIQTPEFFDGVGTKHAEPESYTREKVIGDEGKHVIRFMEWAPEYALLPHEHHGRPCFEVLVEGLLFVAEMDVEDIGGGEYRLTVTETEVCRPGDAAIVDPREGADVHAVYAPVRSKSLHVYPEDNYYAYGYVLQEDSNDVYTRERFQLRESEA